MATLPACIRQNPFVKKLLSKLQGPVGNNKRTEWWGTDKEEIFTTIVKLLYSTPQAH